ncbi:replication protein [Castellaniella ginsengisoli]
MTDTRSPQLEDGFVRIANELMLAILKAPFTGRQQKVIFAIIQKTYGYGKKVDDVSASQIGALCGLSRTHVTATLNQLFSMKVIHKEPGVYGSLVGMNKDYSKWLFASTDSVLVYQSGTSTDSVQGVPKSTFASTDSVQVDSTDSVHTKDNLPKENLQKKKPCASAGAFAQFWAAYPKKKSKVQAEKAFSKINPSEQLLGAMLASIGRAKTSEDWTKSDGQFIPYPATWLNQRRWEDEDGTTTNAADAWWSLAGFASVYEAENAGCTQWIAHQWRNGKRMEAHA